jgi:phospholipase/lecithinase/hemolysin
MKNKLVAAFVLFSVMLPAKAFGVTFDKFFVFGDSLSDTGNAFNATGGLFPGRSQIDGTSPYFDGRFSNGDIWVDYLGKELGLKPTLYTSLSSTIPTQGINFAFGGSNSGVNNAFIPGAPGVQAQVNIFTSAQQTVDPNALYAIWGGANDYLFTTSPDSTTVVNNISNQVKSLVSGGAKNILVFNLPDLGKVPLYSGSSQVSTALTGLSALHNTQLATSLNQLSSQLDASIIPVDINSLFNQVEADPTKFGFTDVANACVPYNTTQITSGNFKVCSEPNDFLFYDLVHPTTKAQKIIAQTALSAINAKSVPEPSEVLGVVAVGVGIVLLRKRKQKSLV